MAQLLNTIRSNLLTGIFGRRLGIDPQEYLGGVKSLREQVVDLTSASSAQELPSYGTVVARISGSITTATQPAFTIGNPVPGVDLKLCYAQTSQAATAGSTALAFIRASTAFYIQSTDGSTGCVVLLTQGSAATLRGISTDAYMFIRHGTSGAVAHGTT
jgi:hypothetical protein